ncbi:MAG: hypothetical protein U0353_03530 [Sandaracinus sp.]
MRAVPHREACLLASLVATLVLGGCDNGPTVTLVVYTDFEVGEQFTQLRYEFVREEDGVSTVQGTLAASDFAPGPPWRATTGPRPFTPSPHEYRVELLTSSGRVVASVTEHSTFVGRSRFEVRTEITRFDCEGVGPCPSGQSCLCGRCYPIACRTERDLDACPGGCCAGVGGCEEPSVRCLESVCLEGGSCAWVPRDGACSAEAWCDPAAGCVPRSDSPPDAGMLLDAAGADAAMLDARSMLDARGPDVGPVDAGMDCPGGCDDGDACNGTEHCVGGRCMAGTALDCDDLVACTADTCSGGRCEHAPLDARCTAMAGGSCDPMADCQYPTCTAATCTPTAGACQEAHCEGATCVRSTLCGGGQQCCGGACVTLGCDDTDPCTADACAPGGCAHTAISGVACTLPHAAGTCDRGSCVVSTCAGGFLDCTPSAGCETAFSTSDCGACGVACGAVESCDASGACSCGAATGAPGSGPACDDMVPNASGRCRMTAPRTCGIATCDPGYDSCDGMDWNGCETQTTTSVVHCGGCGWPCAAGETCVGGTCRCGAAPACAGTDVCTACGCAPSAETDCLTTTGDEDCDGAANCADDDCVDRLCGGAGRTCSAAGFCS